MKKKTVNKYLPLDALPTINTKYFLSEKHENNIEQTSKPDPLGLNAWLHFK